ncbi:MAG: helix-turn-helix domain-containing protein [Chloroflexi bacterium]|nr:helix-turn-helix domain-containing protein [Chloroflexota bacterium]
MMARKHRQRLPWDAASIRKLRQHLEMTQREFSEELGVRQQTVSEWETGAYEPRGPSVTVLTLVAERAAFAYVAQEGGDARDGG